VDFLTVVMELPSIARRAALLAAGAFVTAFLLIWFLTRPRRASAI